MASSSKSIALKPGWEPPFGINLQKAYYDIMEKVGQRWKEFARCGLNLLDNRIADVTQDHPSAIEQRYEMCKIWEERQGQRASVEYLYATLNHFLFPSEYPETPEYQAQTVNDITSQYCSRVRDIVIDVLQAQKGQDFLPAYDRTYGEGKVLIINNKTFSSLFPEREGSEIDVENMKTIWQELGNDVTVHLDLTAFQIKSELKNFAKGLRHCDYFAVVIMSYGNENDKIFGTDGEVLTPQEITEIFDNKNCMDLIGKPKLFFFNYSRGKRLNKKSFLFYHPADQVMMTPCFMPSRNVELISGIEAASIEKEDEDRVVKYDPPDNSDMLICFAAAPGYASMRDVRNGTWFANAITNIFMKHAKREHVLDLMIKVNAAVSEKLGVLKDDDGKTVKSMPYFECSLRKRLYL